MITMHPGEYLSMAYVEPMGLTQARLAKHLQVDKSSVSRLLNGEADLTAPMAVRLSRVFDLSAKAWMEMQSQHSLKAANKQFEGVEFQRLNLEEKEHLAA
jgi:addiction module HigA family antidote